MNNKKVSNITIEDARIIFKNFQGEKRQFNPAGNRNFGVLLSDQYADILSSDGWNVKYLNPLPDDPDQNMQAWLPVKIKFGKYPPVIVVITSKGKQSLTEETVGQLDRAYFKYVDLVVRPYEYPAFNGNPGGIAAYLKAIYVTIQEDDLSIKYGDIPDMDMSVASFRV